MLLGSAFAAGAQQGDAKRGLYVSQAAGCVGCHTEARDDAEADETAAQDTAGESETP